MTDNSGLLQTQCNETVRDFKYQLTHPASKLTMDMPTTAFYFISAVHCQGKCPITPTYHV